MGPMASEAHLTAIYKLTRREQLMGVPTRPSSTRYAGTLIVSFLASEIYLKTSPEISPPPTHTTASAPPKS